MITESGWPLVLSSEATVPAQTTQRPPQLALMNPTGEAFLIHEIRFSATSSTQYLTGANIGCKLDLGKVALTNGFIPIWNFGRVISYDQDLSVQYSWRLQHPLYVQPGGMITTDFVNFGQRSNDVTARVSYFATAVPAETPPPRQMFVPWVSAYIGRAFPYADAGTDVSRETDLVNPFDVDVNISRLIGRFNVHNATTDTNVSTVGSQHLSTRVSLSNGDPLVRTPTPFQQVFGEEGRAWEQRRTILRPKQFFQVFIDKEAADAEAGSTIQPYVSIVGYRQLTVEA